MHFNIQISIQQVEEPTPVQDSDGRTVKTGPMAMPMMTERKVTKILELAVTAGTEREAYAKAHRLISANEPDPEYIQTFSQQSSKPIVTLGDRGE